MLMLFVCVSVSAAAAADAVHVDAETNYERFLAGVSVPFDSINSIKLSFYAAQFVSFRMSLSSLANGYLSGCSI